METTIKKSTRKQRIDSLVEIIEQEQPEALEKVLKRLYFLKKSQVLDKNVINNDIT
ncbi:hypothetical protein AGMMS49574_24200 [Bacteroidia bacterium]|nr:hypothetical protein AGMMS49574_24200 [Bacteroidia bacterium]GHU55554.1 hypothetical protein FACS189411_04240 [Bacteroidia bacterium]